MAPRRTPSLTPWIWFSIVLGILATASYPLCLLFISGSCDPRDKAAINFILAPARPLFGVLEGLKLNSPELGTFFFGLSYGLLCLTFGFLLTAVRKWRLARRSP